ncbi:MAG TPA: GNAT family N-acetyltransferase [Ktedonobacterales bacterium]
MATRLEGLVSAAVLAERQAAEARALARVCNDFEGLDLKLAIPTTPQQISAEPRAFLWYAGGALVGYAGLDHWGGVEGELCGMVHPDHRRRGLGRALLAAVVGICGARGITRLLLVCENASGSSRAFAAAVGARLSSSELHMERDASPIEVAADPALVVRPAGADDADALVRILVEAFGDDEGHVRRRVSGELGDATQPFYLALVAGRPAGALKTYQMEDEIGIYAFAVLPGEQGHGLGRRMLARLVDRLRGQAGRFALEVDPDNAPAIATYRACGFAITTTYGYYALDV